MQEKDENTRNNGSRAIDAKVLGADSHLQFPSILSNFYLQDIDGKVVKRGQKPSIMLQKINSYTAKTMPGAEGETWPKRVGHVLHYIDKKGKVDMILKMDSLFGWLATIEMEVEWVAAASALPRTIFYEFLCKECHEYTSIEVLPHYPEIDNVFYKVKEPEMNDYEGALEEFLDFFNPETPEDRVYMKSMILSLFWGGPGGARPIFVLLGPTDDDHLEGRGTGKTAITEALAELCGPYIDLGSKAKREDMTKQILTAPGSRLITLDNVKEKISNSGLESLTTREYINGHLMYKGNHTVPNFFTWIVTDNQPEFSKDMSQRALPIRLKRPTIDPKWWPRLSKFIKKNKMRIVHDCIRVLKEPARTQLQDYIRFGQWSEEVLAKCTDNAFIATEIKKRQSKTDEEANIVDEFYEIIETNMNEYKFGGGMRGTTYNPAKSRYSVSQPLITKWIRQEMPDIKANRIIKLLAMTQPDWLILPPGGVKKDQSGRIKLGTKKSGARFLDIGAPRVPTAWSVTIDHRINRYVENTCAVVPQLKNEGPQGLEQSGPDSGPYSGPGITLVKQDPNL